MDLQTESNHFTAMNICDYQHDWSSDSDRSRQQSPRSSSASKHSVDDVSTEFDIKSAPTLGNLLKGDRYTALPQPNTAISHTNCTTNITTDDIIIPHITADTESGSKADSLPSSDRLQPHMEGQLSSDEALTARVKENDSGPERAQTPVLQIHDTSASESLHSPRPQRYLRPNVTSSEQDVPGLPMYDDEKRSGEPSQFPFPYQHVPMNVKIPPYVPYAEDYGSKPTNDPIDTLSRVPGFKSFSKEIVRNQSDVKPLYRGFEEIRHRIILHVQHEISEMEQLLERMDKKIDFVNLRQQKLPESPGVSIGSEHLGDDAREEIAMLKHRRTLLLGRIFEKIQQYGKVISHRFPISQFLISGRLCVIFVLRP
jgi:uncharacterized protein DUF6594